MILKRKGRRLPRLTAILLSLGMVVGTTGTNLKVAHAEVMEQLEESFSPMKEGTEADPEADPERSPGGSSGTDTENEINRKEMNDDTDQESDQESDQELNQESDKKSNQESEQGENHKQGKPEDNDRKNNDSDDDEFDDDGLILIIEFEKPDVLVYEFGEKPELDTLLKSFPKTLGVTIEKEVLVASVSDATEITTEDIDVFWECDDDYEESDLDEYIFYPVPDLIGCEVAADEVPEISVILTDTEKETELKSEIEDIKGSRTDSETIDLTANVDGMEVTVTAQAGVLPEDVILKVRKVENRKRIEEMQEAIENHMEEQDQGTTVEEMVVFDVSLWDSEGNEIQPDTTKGEIVVSFRNLGLMENAVLEELEIYHFEDTASTQVMKEEAIVEDEAVVCSVDHFSEYAVVKLMAAQTAGAVAQIGSQTFDTLQSAVDAAGTGDIIQLVDNVYLGQNDAVTIPASSEVVIDLNGKEITVYQDANGRSLYAITNNGTLTIKDTGSSGIIIARGVQNNAGATMYMESGTIESCDSNGGGAAIWNEGTLEMTGGTLNFTGNKAGNSSGISLYNGNDAKASITGGTFNGKYRCIQSSGDLSVENAEFTNSESYWNGIQILGGKAILKNITVESVVGGCLEVSGGNTTLENCTFTQKELDTATPYISTCIAVSNGGTVTVNGGTYTSESYALYVFSSGGTIHIEDGTFEGGKAVAKADQTAGAVYPSTITIEGGGYKGIYQIDSRSTLEISGGSFSENPEQYCVDGFAPQIDAVGNYEVTPENPAVSVTINNVEKTYATLEAGIKAAGKSSDKAEVKLLGNITLSADVVIEGNNEIVLNLNQCTIDGGDYQIQVQSSSAVTITGDGELKNSNGNTSTADYAPLRIFEGSTVVLDGVKVEGKLCAVKNSGNLTVKKAEIAADTYGIGCFGNGKTAIGEAGGSDSDIMVSAGGQAIATAAATGHTGMTVTVYNGTFTTLNTQWDDCPVYWAGHGTLNVYGGIFKNTASGTGAAAILQKNGTVHVYGGEFESKDGIKIVAQGDSTEITAAISGGTFTGTRSGIYIDGSKADYIGKLSVYDVTISNGTDSVPDFNGGSNGAVYTKEDGLNGKPAVVISGGSFSTEPKDEHLADGYVKKPDGNGKYLVTEKVYNVLIVVEGAASRYCSLQEAIDTIPEGASAEIQLLTDMEESVAIPKNVTVSLDLNGKTLSGVGNAAVLGNEGTLTIADSSSGKTGALVSSADTAILNKAMLELTGGTVNGAIKTVISSDQQPVKTSLRSGVVVYGVIEAADAGEGAPLVEITGGTYGSNPDVKYIADGYESVENADGTYTVQKKAVAAPGGFQDGDAVIHVPNGVVPEPQKPEGLAGDMENVFYAAAGAAKNSVASISANTAVAGNAGAIRDLAKAVEENEILELNVQTKVSLEQRLTASEFETIVQTGADGETMSVQVLPKSLTFEVNAFIVHLDKDQNELPDTIQQIDLSSSRMTNKVPFTFRFPVPSEVTALYANVEHEGDPVTQYAIEGSGEAKYITVSVWHLSQFKLTFTNELMTNQGGNNTGNGNNGSGTGNGNNGSGDSGSDAAGSGGRWIQDAVGWWFQRYDGTYPKAQWFECIWNDRTDWYHFNAAGYMDEGWFVDTDGNIYFLHNISDNTRGYMYTGWHLIDGKWYYFNPFAGGPKGALLMSTATPDGYVVNEKGEWVR